jgi:type II secretory pathway pseudopilin PulG
MQTILPRKNRQKLTSTSGFTLLEIMGVAAIAALIVAGSITAVVKSRQRAAMRNVPSVVDQIKAALTTFTSKSGGMAYPPLTVETATGSIPTTGALLGAASATVVTKACTLDNVLLTETVIDKPINLDFGTRTNVPNGTSTAPVIWNTSTNTFNCVPDATPTQDFSNMTHLQCAMSTTNAPGTDGTNFFLDNSGTAMATNTRVVALVIPGVGINDAIALANYVSNSTSATATGNTMGPVAYATPTAGLTTVYYYIAAY